MIGLFTDNWKLDIGFSTDNWTIGLFTDNWTMVFLRMIGHLVCSRTFGPGLFIGLLVLASLDIGSDLGFKKKKEVD